MIDFEAREIENWAGLPDAPHLFPRLLGKLILATTPATSFIDMPSGSAVWLPGWDGLLEVDGGNSWVLYGKSAWEFGTGNNPQRKANEDYNKRSAEPLGVDTKAVTFVFVTPRVWCGKQAWVEARRVEGRWADVRAYDANDLVLWLGQAPGVADWFARLIGKLPDAGFACLDYWWENWAPFTQPEIAPELVLAGRSEQVEAVRNWLEGSPSRFYVQGDTRDEAIAFLAASAFVAHKKYRASLLSRAIVVENPEAWRSLIYSRYPMVLIRNFVGDMSSQIAVKNGHHVVVPLDRAQDLGGNGIQLPKLGRDETLEALQSMGKSESQARALSRKSARRLPVMRRRLLDEAGAPPPGWASSQPSRALTALVLIGQWSEKKEGDKEIVANIAGKPYQEVEQALIPLLNIADAPLIKIGERWRYVSHEEAWHILAPYLTSTDVARLEELASGILSRKHPKFDLPIEERWYASIKGKDLPFSGTLVEGVARGLALMGTQPERMVNVQNARYIPDRVVRRVLSDDSDWRTWATLSGHLATLSEAAPDAFLDAVERTLDARPSAFKELFGQDRDPMFSGSPHTGLLWGLERLAWSKDYFSRVAVALARFAEIDPGGQVANRPAASLAELFCSWIKHTEATDEYRIDTLSMLLEKYPKAGWTALVKLVPSVVHNGVVLREPPLWRPWGQDGHTIASRNAIWQYLEEVIQLLLIYVCNDVARWKDLMDILHNLPERPRREALQMLTRLADTLKQDTDAEVLRATIRTELHRHRSYPDADWAMPSDDVELLSAIYDKLTPTDPVAANAWLFNSDWPDLPDGERMDYEEQRKRAEAAQQETVVAIYESGGLDAIERLLDAVNYPHIVSEAVASRIDADDIFPMALECLMSDSPNRQTFAMNFLNRICRESGWAVLDKALDAVKSEDEVNPETVASIYKSATPVDLKTCLQRLDDECQAVQDAYWRNADWFNFTGSEIEIQDRLTAVRHLLKARRSISAAELIWRTEVPSEIVLLTLEQIPVDWTNGTDISSRDLGYRVSQLFENLDKSEDVSEEVIANLEMRYIGMLENHRPNLALHREVLRQPSLFADLIAWMFKRADGTEDDTVDEQTRAVRSTFSFRTLSNLRGLPGMSQDGMIDAETLETWVSEARRLCEERDRRDMGDHQVGKVLANACIGEDGIWPCEPVRDLLDKLSLPEHVGRGFVIGKSNLRGVITRETHGGAQERELAESYRKDAAKVAARWPFTANLLRQLAQYYEADARREDTRSEWTEEAWA